MEKIKATHSTTLPYSKPTWPKIAPVVENEILQLLLPLLRPIGDSRRLYALGSKGRGRRKKRKPTESTAAIELPEEPAAASMLSVGFNSTVRSLEGLARHSPPLRRETEEQNGSAQKPLQIAIVIACPASIAPPTLDSIPLLVATTSLADKTSEPIRLVEISAQGETALAHALAMPRVGVLALDESFPGAQALFHYVQSTVTAVDVPWLKEVSSSSYLPLKLKTANIPIGSKGPRKRKASDSGGV